MWQDHLEGVLVECGFESDLLDQALFVHPVSKMMICCHVDDLLTVGDPVDAKPMLERIGQKLQVKYAEVTETPTVYLGRELQRVNGGYRFGIGKNYVRSMMHEFGWSACKAASVLPGLEPDGTGELLSVSDQRRYRQLVGRLMWYDRWDIRFLVCQSASRCGKAHEGIGQI